jgi:hypothetical protein
MYTCGFNVFFTLWLHGRYANLAVGFHVAFPLNIGIHRRRMRIGTMEIKGVAEGLDGTSERRSADWVDGILNLAGSIKHL